MARIIFLFICMFSFSVFANVSVGQWYMNDSQAPVEFSPCAPQHGDDSEYAYSKIPTWPQGWRLADDPNIVGLSKESELCDLYSCRCGGKFTYFRNTVKIPKGFAVTRFEIELRGMDDGTKITLFNSKYPNGISPPGAIVYLGGSLTQDLKQYTVDGETNIVILTHVDDCCTRSNLQEAYIRVNDKRVDTCLDEKEICDGKDNDCDGLIDESEPGENGLCGGLGLCACGKCVESCSFGECKNGQPCRNGFCLDPCCANACPKGSECLENGSCKTGECGECKAGEFCDNGNCTARVKDCRFPEGKCKAGEVCGENGTCSSGPCKEKECAAEEFCRVGEDQKATCVAICTSCKPGEKCEDGKCIRPENECKATCPSGLVCLKKSCLPNPCFGFACEPGKVCKLSQSGDPKCEKDLCLDVSCPAGSFCNSGSCSKAVRAEVASGSADTESSGDSSASSGNDSIGDEGSSGGPVTGKVESSGCSLAKSEKSVNGSLLVFCLFAIITLLLRYSVRREKP